MTPSITITFNLGQVFPNLDQQLIDFDKLVDFLKERNLWTEPQVSASVRPSINMGPNEEKYLSYSGKSRMNMRDKTISREEQAIIYLQGLGLDIIPIDIEPEDVIVPQDIVPETETDIDPLV